MSHNTVDENLLEVPPADQYRTVEELIEKTKPGPNYYTMLILSAIIISIGLLLNNTAIVIGGMLVTPILTPILVISLGVAVRDGRLMRRVTVVVIKSIVFVIFTAIIFGFIFGAPAEFTIISNSLRTAILYFVVALASGIAVTFAWIHKESSEAIPGIAIAVSLVPPIALVGIALSALNMEIVWFYLMVLALNLFGILTGSLIVFTLSKFNRARKKVQEKNEEVIVEEHLQDLKKDLDKELEEDN